MRRWDDIREKHVAAAGVPRYGRAAVGYWSFGITRSPHGWLFNLGVRWVMLGLFAEECDADNALARACTHPELYYCGQTQELECPRCGGFDTCCAAPQSHVPWPTIRDGLEKLLAEEQVEVIDGDVS
jgi:hypothetical protein